MTGPKRIEEQIGDADAVDMAFASFYDSPEGALARGGLYAGSEVRDVFSIVFQHGAFAGITIVGERARKELKRREDARE